jgi:hypothetical protein
MSVFWLRRAALGNPWSNSFACGLAALSFLCLFSAISSYSPADSSVSFRFIPLKTSKNENQMPTQTLRHQAIMPIQVHFLHCSGGL